jgi:hypothetical protein
VRKLFFVVAGSLLIHGPAMTQAAPTMPSLTAESAGDYFLIGNDLWSAATDRLVAKDFLKGIRPRLVAGRPDMLLYEGYFRTERGLAGEGTVVHRLGHAWPYPTVEVCAPPSACEQQGFRALPGPVLSSDLRRVIYIRSGDLWRADVDWVAGKIANHQQVTKVGVLGNPGKLHWYQNTLLLEGNLSQEKPILRIDLSSGSIEELPRMDMLGGKIANPAGYRLCASEIELLSCMDVRTGKRSRMGIASAIQRDAPGSPTPALFEPTTTFWVDDETVVSVGGDVPMVVRGDFRAGRAEVVYQHTEPVGTVRGAYLIPGGRYLSIETARGLLRVDLQDRTVVSLPDDMRSREYERQPIPGLWLDENRYVYSKASGGLTEMGTWIYDVRAANAKRICQFPAGELATGRLDNGIAFFPRRNVMYFPSPAQGGGVFKADLSTNQCRQIVSTELGVSRVDTRPVDLRLNLAGSALW